MTIKLLNGLCITSQLRDSYPGDSTMNCQTMLLHVLILMIYYRREKKGNYLGEKIFLDNAASCLTLSSQGKNDYYLMITVLAPLTRSIS